MQPLKGLTVVSLEHAIAAPFATRQLADLGARVIKIERPGVGDFARGYDQRVKGLASHFVWTNRSKESLTLDLKHPRAAALLLQLVLERADCVVQNLAPGAAARLGLSHEALKARRPDLIVCDISGYGDDPIAPGPYRDRKAYDLLIQSESGFVSITGTPDEPSKAGLSIADIAAGMYAYSNILAALLQRRIDGLGRRIDISMLEAMGEWMGYPLYYAFEGAAPPPRAGAAHATIYPYGPFDCSDGTVLIATQNNDEWERLCASLDLPDLAARSDFATNALRDANRAGVDQILKPIFARMRLDEAISLLQEAGVAWGRYTEIRELGQHAALRRVDVALASGARVTVPLPAGRDITAFRAGPVPALGEHTDRVRREFSRELVDD